VGGGGEEGIFELREKRFKVSKLLKEQKKKKKKPTQKRIYSLGVGGGRGGKETGVGWETVINGGNRDAKGAAKSPHVGLRSGGG